DSSSTRGQRNWGVGSPDERKGAQRTETATDRVDPDRGDAMSRQPAAHEEQGALLVVQRAVTPDGHRPPERGRGPGWEDQREEDLVCALDSGPAAQCCYGRNVQFGGQVVRRPVLS